MIEVITRLPFENPKDLFVQKISNHLLAQAKSPFNDYSLPLAILKLNKLSEELCDVRSNARRCFCLTHEF